MGKIPLEFHLCGLAFAAVSSFLSSYTGAKDMEDVFKLNEKFSFSWTDFFFFNCITKLLSLTLFI